MDCCLRRWLVRAPCRHGHQTVDLPAIPCSLWFSPGSPRGKQLRFGVWRWGQQVGGASGDLMALAASAWRRQAAGGATATILTCCAPSGWLPQEAAAFRAHLTGGKAPAADTPSKKRGRGGAAPQAPAASDGGSDDDPAEDQPLAKRKAQMQIDALFEG